MMDAYHGIYVTIKIIGEFQCFQFFLKFNIIINTAIWYYSKCFIVWIAKNKYNQKKIILTDFVKNKKT